jgi:hypothetical protein
MEQVTLGPDRIVDVIKPGGLYIDHTMNSPLLGAGGRGPNLRIQYPE